MPSASFVELQLKFGRVSDDDLIRRFFEYARWCMQSPGEGRYLSDAGTAAVCAFYEHLPQHANICRELPRWLTREEFASLRGAFRHHLSEQEFSDFEAEFLDETKRGLRQ